MNSNHVTVAVCTFNRQQLLKPALESLMHLRTNPSFDYDIVLVDDASTDGTLAVAHSMQALSPVEFHYLQHIQNMGVAAARNTCIQNARGEWVAFFDDDQIADQNWLINLLTTAKATGADCIGGSYHILLEPGS